MFTDWAIIPIIIKKNNKLATPQTSPKWSIPIREKVDSIRFDSTILYNLRLFFDSMHYCFFWGCFNSLLTCFQLRLTIIAFTLLCSRPGGINNNNNNNNNSGVATGVRAVQ